MRRTRGLIDSHTVDLNPSKGTPINPAQSLVRYSVRAIFVLLSLNPLIDTYADKFLVYVPIVRAVYYSCVSAFFVRDT
ncbi:hypothetical protein OUZ56_014640 [Daphnia magna]|uniref:Uncharacterized protein n=1 Tax=Daphnia magna TaxID=35525 RepID=A0ABR0AKC3_9CRUS|nr:hypothetical protein OUZ56_014640 [Daphnia magna]